MTKPRISDEQLVRVLGVCRRENAGFDERYVPLVDLLADFRDCRAALAEKERLLNESAQIVVDLQAALAQEREAAGSWRALLQFFSHPGGATRDDERQRRGTAEWLHKCVSPDDPTGVRNAARIKAAESRADRAEAACARMREALETLVRAIGPADPGAINLVTRERWVEIARAALASE